MRIAIIFVLIIIILAIIKIPIMFFSIIGAITVASVVVSILKDLIK